MSRSAKICSRSVFSTWIDIPPPQCLPTSTGRENKKRQHAQYMATAKKMSTAVEEIPGKFGKEDFNIEKANLIMCLLSQIGGW